MWISAKSWRSWKKIRRSRRGCCAWPTPRVRLTAQALTTLQESRNLVEGVNWKHLWIHSFACALLSPEIPRRLRIPVPEYAYLAGIVHDLGKILLSSLQPAEYRKLLMEASMEGTPLLELERRQFGVTHEEAGAVFARQNHFPTGVVAAVEFHSRPVLAADDATLAAVVNVANFLAKAHGLGFSGSPLGPDEEALEDTKGWQLLQDVVAFPQKADEFHLFLRPFLHDLKQELHEWVSGKRMGG
jgi:HD superfamily phosphohydrolase YqeK